MCPTIMLTAENTKRPPSVRAVDQESHHFNICLLKIVDGEKGIVGYLSAITGLSVDGIKSRVKRARYAPPEELERFDAELDREDLAYLDRVYGRSDDPAVRDWLGTMRPTNRAHPNGTRFRNADRPDGRTKPHGRARLKGE